MLWWLSLLACEQVAQDSAVGPCGPGPHLSWESHGQAILTEYCQPCHASGSELRNGAPETVSFDTPEQAWLWADRIQATATVEEPSMPPNIRMSELDQDNLRAWLSCGSP